jgi:hypothetical protein
MTLSAGLPAIVLRSSPDFPALHARLQFAFPHLHRRSAGKAMFIQPVARPKEEPTMIAKQLDFIDLCRAVEEGVETDLSAADRELLIILHKALTGLKAAVEKALLSSPIEKHLTN